MRREGLRSQKKSNNMKNNEYKKLDNNEEFERISLNDLKDQDEANSKTRDTYELVFASGSENEDGDENENSTHDEPVVVYKQNLKKDFNNICLLMFLYFLQGTYGTRKFNLILKINLINFL